MTNRAADRKAISPDMKGTARSGSVGRSVPEWIGSSPDAAIPPRVRRRVFDRYHGACQACLRAIDRGEWDCDHIIPLSLGGEHRESNLRPLCRWCHRMKTAREALERAKSNRVRNRELGIRKTRGRPMPGTKASGWRHRMDGTWERR